MSARAFGCLTLKEFWLLWERRRIAFKRQCYLSGITAAALFNSRRTDASQQAFYATDFVPRNEEEAQREEIIGILRQELARLIETKSDPKIIATAKERWRSLLTEKGLDAEELIADIFEGME